ncbi:MAG: DUF4956 domain-containing protein [Phycisphaerales bacterium]|nr:DUF4956 domain-containing protein [Phycisphaerales bacterium]MCI0632215.1 DUF4956 domain-containing protein [Phycisphaerales bacterium]MCI0676166.1 DUF4956 domain-containing protein [Phycisphaerales bacterium]
MEQWLDMIWRGDLGAGVAGPETALQAMLLAFCLGHVAGWVYMWTHAGLSYSRMFVGSLVIIPVIVSLLMMLMAGNIFIAFGLLAVFAVVRFRNVLKDTRDTVFVLWSMAMGMGAGTMRFSTVLIGAAFIAFSLLYLSFVGFGSRRQYDTVLSLRWTGGNDIAGLRALLRRYCLRSELASERGTPEAHRDLSYRLLLRDPSTGASLVSELQALGASDTSIYRREDEAEQ